MILKFAGTEADFGNVKLNQFGQVFEVKASEVKELLLGAGPDAGFAGAINALPADQFDAIGFSDNELASIADPGPRAYATGALASKIHKTHEAVAQYRESLIKPAKDTGKHKEKS